MGRRPALLSGTSKYGRCSTTEGGSPSYIGHAHTHPCVCARVCACAWVRALGMGVCQGGGGVLSSRVVWIRRKRVAGTVRSPFLLPYFQFRRLGTIAVMWHMCSCATVWPLATPNGSACEEQCCPRAPVSLPLYKCALTLQVGFVALLVLPPPLCATPLSKLQRA